MASVNKCVILGNVGQDPEVRYMANGDPVVNMSVATSETWKDKNTGQKQEKTEWHRVSIFGGLAKIAAEYVHKGSKIYLEGKLQTRKWQDQNGNDRYSTEVVVDGFNGALVMLDSANSGGGQQQGQGQQQNYQQNSGNQNAQNNNQQNQQYNNQNQQNMAGSQSQQQNRGSGTQQQNNQQQNNQNQNRSQGQQQNNNQQQGQNQFNDNFDSDTHF